MWQEKTVATRSTISQKVQAYEGAQAKIRDGYRLLSEAQQELRAAFSVDEHSWRSYEFDVLPPRGGYHNDVLRIAESVELECRKRAWRQLYAMLDIDKIMSIKRGDEIRKKLDDGDLPEITLHNIATAFETLVQNAGTFAKEIIEEIYDWIRPAADSHRMKEYKTNQKYATFELGKKVILTGCFNYGRVSDYQEKYLIALDKVFYLLDGKSMMTEGYRSPLVDALNGKEDRGETEYFSFQAYGNGNVHLQFRRMDLVKEFNRIAGGLNLKPKN